MITQTEAGGVPVLLAPTTGPTHAGLAFRVGFADEPLARRGITHLTEHLALHSMGVTDYHYNGATGVEFTYFHMQGDEDKIVGFLNGVCASLRDLPMRRLAVEKDVLQAEASGRSPAVAEPMALWRHGARDYGTPAYPEWGLPAITEDELRAWVARYFTRENAVLWVAGDAVPAGLELDLPSGVRHPTPAPSSALPVTPAFFPGSSGLVVWDAMTPRGAKSAIFADVLERVMFRELRQEAGLSYTVQTDYQPIGRDGALVTAVADGLPENQGAVLGGMVDVLAALRAGRVDPADVAAVVTKRVEQFRHAESVGARLPGQALNLLLGRPVEDIEQVIGQSRAVTAADVAEAAAGAWQSGLLMSPVHPEHLGFAAAPSRSETAVHGYAHTSLEEPGHHLIVARGGVSLVQDENVATVRYADCVIARAWPDGARQLVGADGIVVRVEPTLFADGQRAIGAIDAATGPVRVFQPPRAADDIPKPQPRAKRAAAAVPVGGNRALSIFFLVVLWPAVLFFGAIGALLVISLFVDTEDLGATIVALVFCLGVAVAGAFGIRASMRRLRAARA
ncbi:M16 family metallopeptidase [Paractinoplanes globisporus]|uniref:M16 family metallopeptidase n=1 Tax=Paractinoplanes globisporus TaxID=113565 RepID=A0ABW6WE76_9ACTN|nr:insulinase family protein [Actinoplanes globisporus]